MFQHTVETDMIPLAHHVFWAVETGVVQWSDDSDLLKQVTYDEAAIQQMIRQNVLGIGKIKLYAAETKTPALYAFYYSENVLDAHALHEQSFKESPKRMGDASHLLGRLFEFEAPGTSNILYFHRSEVAAYPYYLGHAWAGERRFFRIERKVG